MGDKITEYTKTRYIRAYGKGCYGCERHEKDVMLCVGIDNDSKMLDIFLDQKKAKEFSIELQRIIQENDKE